MIQIFEAPSEPSWTPYTGSIFLAGGITGVRDWQADAVSLLVDKLERGREVRSVFNPRRAKFDVTDLSVSKAQIRWEHRWLGAAEQIVFWFSNETVQPITLFELGAALERRRQVIRIGCHPGYTRRVDVIEQARLAGWKGKVRDTLEATIKAVK